MSSKGTKALRRPLPGGVSKAARAAWLAVWYLLYRPTPVFMHGWRRVLLRMFGADIAKGAHPYPSARIWAPWNLTMGERSCLGYGVECYNVERITLRERCIVSQHAYLCTASHDIEAATFDLVTAPIDVGPDAWVAARAYVGPGASIGAGAVVAACAVVTKNVDAWTVVAGNPAIPVKQRTPRP